MGGRQGAQGCPMTPTPIPEWATRAAEAVTPYQEAQQHAQDVGITAAAIAYVLGPEREALEAEVERLTRERDAARVPLCIGRRTISKLAAEGAYLAEDGRGLIAADDLFHQDPWRERDAAREALREIAGTLAGETGMRSIARRALGEEE